MPLLMTKYNVGHKGNTQLVKIENSASTKSHGKIENRYFRIMKMGTDAFFDADYKAPHMT